MATLTTVDETAFADLSPPGEFNSPRLFYSEFDISIIDDGNQATDSRNQEVDAKFQVTNDQSTAPNNLNATAQGRSTTNKIREDIIVNQPLYHMRT